MRPAASGGRPLARESMLPTPCAMSASQPRPRPLASLCIVLAVSVAILWAMNRPPICTCGSVELWGEVGPKQSQMLADWYSPSHIVHGLLFYAAFRLLWPKSNMGPRFLAA